VVDHRARTYLPTDDNAPDLIRELYKTKPIDFDRKQVSPEKLEAFKRLVAELCHDFTVYSGMFGKEETRLSTNKLGRNVMLVVERSLLTQICLRYAALVHDNSKRQKGGVIDKSEEVISLKELIEPLNSDWLNSTLVKMKSFYIESNLKKWRNKVIAHNDFKIFQNRSQSIPKLTEDIIRQQLEMLNDCLNYLQNRYDVHTDVEVQLEFGEGLDKYRSSLNKL
jgi:hypothetical protein